MPKPPGAAKTCGVAVKSPCCDQYVPVRELPTPTPATSTSGRRRSRARSTDVMTYAPPPSEMRQQSSFRNGSQSIGLARYCSSESGFSRMTAAGVRFA
jgi:hypothetical protein